MHDIAFTARPPTNDQGAAVMSVGYRTADVDQLDHDPQPPATVKFLIPCTPPGFLFRARLHNRLERATGPLTLVSAGPGWGKSMLLASWVQTRRASAARAPVAWLTADCDDNDPVKFWASVTEAATGPHPETVVVIDDFHLVDHPELLASLDAWLRTPTRLRLILITRTDPAMPLRHLRAGGSLTEIRAADLALTEPETKEFLRLHGQAVPTSELTYQVQRTQGQPAKTRLAAMSLARAPLPDSSPGTIGHCRISCSRRSWLVTTLSCGTFSCGPAHPTTSAAIWRTYSPAAGTGAEPCKNSNSRTPSSPRSDRTGNGSTTNPCCGTY